MKNTLFLFRLLLAVGLLASGFHLQAQSWAPASPVKVCPGETGTYTLTVPSNYRLSTSYPSSISGGTITNAPTLSSGKIVYQVQWKDDPTGGKLTPALEAYDGTNWQSLPSPSLIAQIRSVANFAGFVGTVPVEYCSTAPFTLTGTSQDFPTRTPR